MFIQGIPGGFDTNLFTFSREKYIFVQGIIRGVDAKVLTFSRIKYLCLSSEFSEGLTPLF